MEQDDAGLQLVRHIREVLRLSEVRIILRAGQPGYAPEIDAIRDFDINDYKTKSELTRIKLYTTVTAAIHSSEQITAINASRRGLELIVRASTTLMALHGYENFAAGVIRETAVLLGLAPHGVLYLQEHAVEGPEGLSVIAAVGNSARLRGLPVGNANDARLAGAVALALGGAPQCLWQGLHSALFSGGRAPRLCSFS
jgi:hypothetical protein